MREKVPNHAQSTHRVGRQADSLDHDLLGTSSQVIPDVTHLSKDQLEKRFGTALSHRQVYLIKEGGPVVCCLFPFSARASLVLSMNKADIEAMLCQLNENKQIWSALTASEHAALAILTQSCGEAQTEIP